MMDEKNHAKLVWALAQPEPRYGLVYRRTRKGVQRAEARFDGLAGCLRTPKGGSSRQIVIVAGRGVLKSRLLTPREAARLMGAPDSFILPERYSRAYEAMGDAVCAPVVGWLSKHLLIPIAEMLRLASSASYPREIQNTKQEALPLAVLAAAQFRSQQREVNRSKSG
jgi:DNA (cytosine-5)-methyltransferase 1